tara:strand:- start:1441 stop:3864 length:2424 start_codon:yes stop_codon:yes gene_type:complete
MTLNLVSPGVKVREVDLTVGRIDGINDQVGAIAGPFEKGPVNEPILIETEADLLETFGAPKSADAQYEYWMSASSYLSYGGILRVLRTSNTSLSNANASVGVAITDLSIKSSEDYYNNRSSTTEDWLYAARNPGSWANDLKICTIDSQADQRIAIGTDGLVVGFAVTAGFSTSVAQTDGTVGVQTGYLKGIITGINAGSVDVKVVSKHNVTTDVWSATDYEEGSTTGSFQGYDAGIYDEYETANSTVNQPNRLQIFDTAGASQRVERQRFQASVGIGSTVIGYSGDFSAVKSAPGDQIKSVNGTYTGTIVSYATTNGQGTIIMDTAATVAFANTDFLVMSGISSGLYLREGNTVTDWYDQQTLGLTNSTVYWKQIADRPTTTEFAKERNAKNDEFHVLVVDDTGKVTGNSGSIVEKWTGLSKANDAKVSPSTDIYYKNYVANYSNFAFVGAAQTGIGLKHTSLGAYAVDATGVWGTKAQGVTFNGAGPSIYSLANGVDYGSVDSYKCTLGDIVTSYTVLDNPAEYSVNYLIQGPSSGDNIYEAQAKANKLISIASVRKDCIACISPYRAGVVGLTNSDQQTANIISFYDSLTSSSYAVFDSGYKYTYDRFNNTFRYIPLNGDTAGLMARTSINSFPWFSPAGSTRGTINNAIKLAYNPSQAQRDELYPKRINPIIFSPGAGIVLFGDKTAQKEASAFDRINVRRLFLTIEGTIERAARSQLFEFNDDLTRTNFLNIVEPYLRDVKAKRGISDFVVICDETNNTPAVIDANTFKADIFVKPARSINFIGLTFVATRTGISFDEVVGSA